VQLFTRPAILRFHNPMSYIIDKRVVSSQAQIISVDDNLSLVFQGGRFVDLTWKPINQVERWERRLSRESVSPWQLPPSMKVRALVTRWRLQWTITYFNQRINHFLPSFKIQSSQPHFSCGYQITF